MSKQHFKGIPSRNALITVKKSLIDNIESRDQDSLELTAIEYFDNRYLYGETFAKIDSYAAAFTNYGIQRGDVVTLCLPAMPEMIFCFYALNRIGAVAQRVNPDYFRLDGTRYINDTDCELMVIFEDFLPRIYEELCKTSIKTVVVFSLLGTTCNLTDYQSENNTFMDGHIFISDFEGNQKHRNDHVYREEEDAAIFYTSGTTGNPKGVILTNDGLNNMIAIYDAMNGMGKNPGDRVLVLIPPMYATGI